MVTNSPSHPASDNTGMMVMVTTRIAQHLSLPLCWLPSKCCRQLGWPSGRLPLAPSAIQRPCLFLSASFPSVTPRSGLSSASPQSPVAPPPCFPPPFWSPQHFRTVSVSSDKVQMAKSGLRARPGQLSPSPCLSSLLCLPCLQTTHWTWSSSPPLPG